MAAKQKPEVIEETPVDSILRKATKENFATVVVVGATEDGLINILSSHNNFQNLQWLLGRAQFKINVHENIAEEKARKAKTEAETPSE